MADHEHARIGVVRREQPERVLAVEPVGQHVDLVGLDVQRLAGKPRRVAGAHLRARVAGRELLPEPGEGLARGECLTLAAGGQLAVGVGL